MSQESYIKIIGWLIAGVKNLVKSQLVIMWGLALALLAIFADGALERSGGSGLSLPWLQGDIRFNEIDFLNAFYLLQGVFFLLVAGYNHWRSQKRPAWSLAKRIFANLAAVLLVYLLVFAGYWLAGSPDILFIIGIGLVGGIFFGVLSPLTDQLLDKAFTEMKKIIKSGS